MDWQKTNNAKDEEELKQPERKKEKSRVLRPFVERMMINQDQDV